MAAKTGWTISTFGQSFTPWMVDGGPDTSDKPGEVFTRLSLRDRVAVRLDIRDTIHTRLSLRDRVSVKVDPNG